MNFSGYCQHNPLRVRIKQPVGQLTKAQSRHTHKSSIEHPLGLVITAYWLDGSPFTGQEDATNASEQGRKLDWMAVRFLAAISERSSS
jgi:hypothetical protein